MHLSEELFKLIPEAVQIDIEADLALMLEQGQKTILIDLFNQMVQMKEVTT